MKKQKGFTLIELLVVIGIIAILAAIVIIAINPARQFALARNAQRWSNVNTIINGVWQYGVDNQGTLPATITATSTEICRTGAASCTGLVDLSVLTENGTYVVAIPNDPKGASTNGTGYFISTTNGRVTVTAPSAELDETIEATR
ncbi:MAG: prepilin-type N-terminal cleavage/methylation domain-containing protein [Patescibacteria group bacterium]